MQKQIRTIMVTLQFIRQEQPIIVSLPSDLETALQQETDIQKDLMLIF